MPVSASAVVCRELVAAHAATSKRAGDGGCGSLGFANIVGHPRECCEHGTRTLPDVRHKNPRRGGVFLSPKSWTDQRRNGPATLAGAWWALLCFVDAQRPAVHLKAVKGLDRRSAPRLGHVDESETTRLPVSRSLMSFTDSTLP